MRDFKIVHTRSLLDVYSIAPIRGFSPPSVVVVGADMASASEVIYNGVLATEFIVSSPTRLIVRIPPTQVGKDLTDFKVFASKPVLRGDASLVLELSKPLQSVSGMDRLVQSWMMIFLTTPGSDVFSPQSGGGAMSIIGSPIDRMGKSAAADLSVAIDNTQRELIKLQSQTRGIPPEERLLSSSLESIVSDESTGTLSARVLLQNMVNQTAQVSLS
jgi:hypothetical protein